MPEIGNRTLADLSPGVELYAACPECGHHAQIERGALVLREEADAALDAFRRRLRCARIAIVERVGNLYKIAAPRGDSNVLK